MINLKQTATRLGGNIAIISLGETPEWVTRFPSLKGEEPSIAIIIIRSTSEFEEIAKFVSSSRHGTFAFIIVITTTLKLRDHSVCNLSNPWAWIIETKAEAIEFVSEAMGYMLAHSFIGYDFNDCRLTSGLERNIPKIGRANVVHGLYEERIANELRDAMKICAESGFDGGACLMQCIKEGDWSRFDLRELDKFVGNLFCPSDVNRFMLTSSVGTSMSAWVILKFQ